MRRQLVDSLESRRLLAAGFQISVSYEASVNSAVQSVIQQAVSRWQQVITGDVPDVGAGAWGAAVDDIRITARVRSIDGAGNGVAQARPLYIRNGSHLPIAGEIEIDSSDIAAQTAAGTLFTIVTHEIGHALGFGTTWSQYSGITSGLGGGDPQFRGANALREYRNLTGNFGATGVPLENTGGTGTRDAHWRESLFRTELMTGTLGPGLNQLSRVTIGQFQDLGYTVNYNAADAFSLGSSNATVSGTVFNDSNSNGSRDFNESALSGVRIYVDSNFNKNFDGNETSVLTDANGNYNLSVAAGGYSVRSVVPSGGVVVFPGSNEYWVSVSGGQNASGRNFAIRTGNVTPPPPPPPTGTSITGNVFNDANSNGAKDGGEGNLSGVRVYIDSNFNKTFDGNEMSALTDGNGNYTLNVSGGGYSVRSVLPSGGVIVAPGSNEYWVTVNSGQNASGRNFAIRTGNVTPPPPPPTGTGISGNVFNDSNSNGIKDGGEGNLSGVRVYVDSNYNKSFDGNEVSALTDGNGNYTLNVSGGGYSVRSVLPSGGTIVSPGSNEHWVTLNNGQLASGRNFAIRTGTVTPPPSGGTISGSVFKDSNRNGQLNSGEAGLGGYVIFLDTNYNGIRDGNELFTTSSSNGNYTLSGVAGGGYNLMIVLGSSQIIAPASKFYWVTLNAGGSVSGRNFAIA